MLKALLVGELRNSDTLASIADKIKAASGHAVMFPWHWANPKHIPSVLPRTCDLVVIFTSYAPHCGYYAVKSLAERVGVRWATWTKDLSRCKDNISNVLGPAPETEHTPDPVAVAALAEFLESWGVDVLPEAAPPEDDNVLIELINDWIESDDDFDDFDSTESVWAAARTQAKMHWVKRGLRLLTNDVRDSASPSIGVGKWCSDPYFSKDRSVGRQDYQACCYARAWRRTDPEQWATMTSSAILKLGRPVATAQEIEQWGFARADRKLPPRTRPVEGGYGDSVLFDKFLAELTC